MESLIFILYILLVITLVRTLLSILRSSKPSPRLPPGPMPLPVIGSLLKLGDKPHKSLAELAKLYGPIMSLKLGRKTVVVVSSPALAREVLQKQDLAFPTRSVPKAIHAHGHNKYSVAWLPVADQWRSLRKALNSNIFSGKLDPPTPISKRKRAAPSPTSSANSVIGENSVQVPAMDRKKLDVDDWSFVNTQIFIQIMLDEARKEHGFNSRKKRVFNDLQWRSIYNELLVRTGRTAYTPTKVQQKFVRLKQEYRIFDDLVKNTGCGWDIASQTVTASETVWQTYVQGHPGAAKYRQKGLDHYDQLQELLESSLANGALGQPSTLKPPTSEEEVAMYEVGKPIKREDSVSMGKRKSDGSGGSNSKSMRFEKKEAAYEKTAFANQMRGEYYGLLADSRRAQEACSIPNCLALLEEIQPIIGTQQYLKAYNKLLSEESQRKGFVSIKQEWRVDWANDL